MKTRATSQPGPFQHMMAPFLHSLYLDWATPNPIFPSGRFCGSLS